jgi:1-acyl-sn-glycerol-3-phosphate acyltransferase
MRLSDFQFRRRGNGKSVWRIIWWWIIMRDLSATFVRIFHRLRVSRRDRIPPSGALIIVSNHQSNLDPMILGQLVGDRCPRFVARHELLAIPVFGWLMAGYGMIVVRRGESDIKAIREVLKDLDRGDAVVIFPEGTRTPDGSVKAFQRGLQLLIGRSGAPVLPVAIEGAYDSWAIGTKGPRWTGRIRARAGEVITAQELSTLSGDEGSDLIRRRVEALRMELRAEIREGTNGRLPAAGPGDRPYWESGAAGEAAVG